LLRRAAALIPHGLRPCAITRGPHGGGQRRGAALLPRAPRGGAAAFRALLPFGPRGGAAAFRALLPFGPRGGAAAIRALLPFGPRGGAAAIRALLPFGPRGGSALARTRYAAFPSSAPPARRRPARLPRRRPGWQRRRPWTAYSLALSRPPPLTRHHESARALRLPR
jgi:hypothetical protein